jgi:putative zinc finger/helix-turn-helix YgiT family protein
MMQREFSRKCGKCRHRAVTLVTVPYTVQFDHDGRKYPIAIPALEVPKCGNCGTIALDEEANQQISNAFRRQAKLLTPEEIRAGREKLGLTQQDFADRLGIAVSTLSRWETGAQIQQRSLNRLMRAYFDLRELRQYLDRVAGGELLPGAAPPAVV